MNTDVILESLSINLPLGGGRAHHDVLKKELNGNIKTVLDVGCGRGPFKVFRDYESTGVDIFPKSIKAAKANGNYKRLICCDVRKMDFPAKSFDAVTCIEVIEHLNKTDALALLANMERIARKRIIIMTPWGYDKLPKGKENAYLEHLCGFDPSEFEKRGYRTKPFMAMRWRFGNKLPVVVAGYIVSIIGRPLIWLNPEHFCNDFYAVKDIG